MLALIYPDAADFWAISRYGIKITAGFAGAAAKKKRQIHGGRGGAADFQEAPPVHAARMFIPNMFFLRCYPYSYISQFHFKYIYSLLFL